MKIHSIEKAWLVIGGVMLLVFLAAISVAAFGQGMQPPGQTEHVDPQNVAMDPHFADPGVKEVAPGVYEVNMVAMTFAFTPGVVEVPAGSEVTFRVVSRDVVHGFEIAGTNVNQMVIPGHVTKVTARFDAPGEYLILCNEYCGIGHHVMQGKLVVR